MNFCPKCGRQRSDGARFCTGCGQDYGDAVADGGSELAADPAAEVAQDGDAEIAAQPGAWDVPADATQWERPVDATRMDLTPEPTRLDLPAPAAASEPPTAQRPVSQPPAGRQPGLDGPDPFASWYVPGRPAEEPTETVLGYRSNPGASHQPPPEPGPVVSPPPPYQPPSGRSSGGRRTLWIAVPLIVALAAGGAAYALAKDLGKHPLAQSSTPPTGHAAASASTASSKSAKSSKSSNASASAAASGSGTGTPAPSPSLVAIAPGLGSTAAIAQVETLLSHYFHGINTHNYAEYSSTVTAQIRATQPESHFESGYATTTDSAMKLTSLTDTGGGDLTATVTFTSHQSPADSVDNSACNNWTLNLYLVPSGAGYLISPAPSGYQPTYSDC